jgi:hypothetical protein
MLPLPAPSHEQQVNADIRFVQLDFKTDCAVINGNAELAIGSNQKPAERFLCTLRISPVKTPENDEM